MWAMKESGSLPFQVILKNKMIIQVLQSASRILFFSFHYLPIMYLAELFITVLSQNLSLISFQF